MGFIGTTAAVALGGALIPLAGFLLRVFGLVILLALALAYCDDGHRARNPSYAACTGRVLVPGGPSTLVGLPDGDNMLILGREPIWEAIPKGCRH